MAKGKDGGKGKDKKVKIPKKEHVGRVKVSKKLRKAGEKVWKLADQPIVSEVVAAAMLSAAAALEGKGGKNRDGKAAGLAGTAGAEAGKLADSLRALALDLARRTIDSWEKPSSGKARKGAAGATGGGGAGKAAGGRARGAGKGKPT